MQTAFYKFIELKYCTTEEYLLAKKYMSEANDNEKKCFYDACFSIILQVIRKMYQKKYPDYKIGANIYTKFGLNDEEFYQYYLLYINEYMSEENKEKYDLVINSKTLEAIWQEAKLGLWSSECISIISNKYNIYPTNTKNFIDFYFKNILKYEKSKIQLFKKYYLKFRLFLDYKLENEKDFNQALDYYKIFANAEEKAKFKNTSLEILNKILELPENGITTYLKSLNLSIYNLYLLATLFRPDLEIKIVKLFKEYYDFCDSNSWKAPIIKEKAQNLNIPYKIFIEVAKIYATKILKISDINNVIINNQNKDLRLKFAKAPILQRIYESENEEEFLSLFYNNKIEQEDIFRFCYTYHRELPQNIKNKMEKNLLEKYKIYIKKKQFTPNTTKYTREMIEDFLNSPDFIDGYCLSHSYNSKGLASAINNSKDEELKQRYEEKKKREKETKSSYIENTVLNIINFIENGFISDNKVYPFELIDFYILFFGVSIKQLKTGSLSRDKAAILRSFFLPLENATVLSKNSIVNAHISKAININGVKYLKTFTQDELIEIINFMDYYNIPFNDLLFHQVCIRYATNTLSIYNTKDFALK